jgi:dTDP-4-dehydrorhamnose 3,5-epimerase
MTNGVAIADLPPMCPPGETGLAALLLRLMQDQAQMKFIATGLEGAFVVEPEPASDDRGFFARTFCQREFEAHGLRPAIAQVSVAFNHRKGTVRGMHFQFAPGMEAKLVRCTRGALLDTIVDLRPESPTYRRQFAVELDEHNGRALYVPERFAHGYQTLRDDTEALYQISEFYAPELSSGLRHDDPMLQLTWPLAVTVISARDAGWPSLADVEPELKRRMTITTPAAIA